MVHEVVKFGGAMYDAKQADIWSAGVVLYVMLYSECGFIYAECCMMSKPVQLMSPLLLTKLVKLSWRNLIWPYLGNLKWPSNLIRGSI